MVGALAAGAARAAELPEGYTAVECIIAPNGAYIDTGYKPSQNTRVVMDVIVQGATEYWFGCWDTDYNQGAFAFGNDGGGIYAGYDGQGGTFGSVVPNGRHSVELDGKKVKVDGEDYHSFADASFTLTRNLYLFAQNRAGTAVWHESQASIICYGCTISEGGSVKRNFVPCICESDGAVGLYDTVGGLFYGNNGTGKFIALPSNRTLTTGTYEFSSSFAFTAPAGESALKVAEGATVTLNIPADVTVTLRGGDAFGTTGAGAGVEVPKGATLNIIGAGVLDATGGDAANGANGEQGTTPASYDSSSSKSTAASGGKGGDGGGGAGAGIGGRGGNGGNGGAGGASFTDKWNASNRSGNSGATGAAGSKGGSCGAIEICGSVKVFASGGTAGANGSGGDKQGWCPNTGSTYYWAAYGSGGGGGGGGGASASDIGGGGAGGGGAGGGGGGGLSYTSKSAYYIISYKKNGLGGTGGHGEGSSVGGKGKDRAGESTTYDGSTYPAETVDDGSGYSGGAGGTGGAAGAKGGDGALTVKDSAVVVSEETGYSVGQISETEYILRKQGKLYRVNDGVYTEISYETFNGGTGNLDGGKWYVVKDVISRTDSINVGEGEAANLVLLNRAVLTVDCRDSYQAGIFLPSGHSLNIFGVASGILTAVGTFQAAGIGGGYEQSAGALTVYGGTVTAKGGNGGAGIGGGGGGAGGTVTINGGVVTATSGGGGAGIGGGYRGAGGTVTINGGMVTAQGGEFGAGIGGGGGGAGGTVTINGGTVTAIGGREAADIGGGYDGAGGTLTLGHRVFKIDDSHYQEGVVASFRLPSELHLDSAVIDDGSRFNQGTRDGVSFVACLPGRRVTLNFVPADVGWRIEDVDSVTVGPVFEDVMVPDDTLPRVSVDVLPDLVAYLLPDGSPEATSGVRRINQVTSRQDTLSSGWYVTTGDMKTSALNVQGTANLILADGATLTVDGGIRVDPGNTLNVFCQREATGKLIANGGRYCAGIGGGKGGAGGAITINGGVVTATGGDNGAGIGGGHSGAGGTVTINGGTVTATGNGGGKGIGGGNAKGGGSVSITGGTVRAEGWDALGETVTLGENVAAYDITGGEPGTLITEKAQLTSVDKILILYTPSGPTCEGGTIAWSDTANAWVVTPTGGVTAVTIAGLPDGDFVAVPPSVTKVSGVADAQIKVWSGAYDITGAFTVSGGAIALDENGVVTIGGEEIPVKPTIGDLDEGEPFTVGKGAVTVTVKAIPGLKYALKRTDSLRRGEDTAPYQTVAVETATGTRVTLTDTEPPKGGAFYRVVVRVGEF